MMRILTKKKILTVQGFYYLVTGLWPILHLKSFVEVTGPKNDYWLVQMVGLLSTSAGITMLLAAVKNKTAGLILNLTFALSFFVIDVVYAWNGTIRKIYLGDAVIELIFIISVLIIYFDNSK